MVSEPPITPPVITGDEIRLVKKQLKRILASKYFKSAKQMQNFLKYIVEKTLAGEGNVIKQYTIGVDALSLADDFDPEGNPAVRIMGGRVRKRLKEYYDNNKNNEEIIISIPRGSYIPEFNKNTNIIENLDVSRGPTLALVSFSDKTQSQITNGLLLQLTDTLATELSHFLCLQLVVSNPFADKDQSHLLSTGFKSSKGADYALNLFFQKIDRDDNRYRLTYRLVLLETDEILWSENYVFTDHPIEEQDYVIGKITATVTDQLQGMMHTHWSRKLLTNLDTIPDYHKVLVYFRNYTDNFTADSFVKGVNVCLEALNRNPNDILANMFYASFCRREYVYGRGLVKFPLERGKECIETAIRLSPNSHEIRYVYGAILFCLNDWEHSVEEFELARSISKNNMVTEFGIGFHFCKMNQWDKGLKIVNKAMLLSTNYPSSYHLAPSLHFYIEGKFEQALYDAKKINMPNLVHGSLARCVCYAQLGKQKEAEKEFQEVLNRCPTFMEQGQVQLARFLGTKSIVDKVWDGVLKVTNKRPLN